jgi:hypothetical protein
MSVKQYPLKASPRAGKTALVHFPVPAPAESQQRVSEKRHDDRSSQGLPLVGLTNLQNFQIWVSMSDLFHKPRDVVVARSESKSLLVEPAKETVLCHDLKHLSFIVDHSE